MHMSVLIYVAVFTTARKAYYIHTAVIHYMRLFLMQIGSVAKNKTSYLIRVSMKESRYYGSMGYLMKEGM